MAVFNIVQNFLTLKFTRRIYNNVSPLSGTQQSSKSLSAFLIKRFHSPLFKRERLPSGHWRRLWFACTLHTMYTTRGMSSATVSGESRWAFCDSIYDMTLFTFLIAFGHFTFELLIFRTATINFGVLSPCIVSSESHPRSTFILFCGGWIVDPMHPQATSLVWMLRQYDYYVQA